MSGAEHDEVVVLTNFVNGKRLNLCSATMVAPSLLLTARHCVSDTESAAACTQDGSALSGAGVKGDRPPSHLVVFAGKNGVVPDTEVESNASARAAKLVVESSSIVCNQDIAFLVLDKKLDTPIAPLRLTSPSKTEKVTAIGWGVDETGALPKSREARADLALLGVGPGVYPENPSYGYGSNEFMIGESACAGDSGGPALATSGAVIGVASRAGNGQAREYNYASNCIGDAAHVVYTELSAHKDFVMRAFQEAGEPIWLEGEPDPRAPKPQSSTAETKSGEVTADPAAPADGPAPPPGGSDDAAQAGGCSVSSEPQKGAVEYAAGLVALLSSLLGLRRRFGRRDADGDVLDHPSHHRARMPSLP